MSQLLEDLRKVAGHALSGSDLPTHFELQDLVGALVKTLEHAGITVADDLLPKPVAAVADTVIEAAEPIAQNELDKALAEVARLQAELTGAKAAALAQPAPAPADPAPAPAAASEPPASTGPAEPPIEGAN